MEHLVQKDKCSIFHNIFKYMIFQMRQNALFWSKGLIALSQTGSALASTDMSPFKRCTLELNCRHSPATFVKMYYAIIACMSMTKGFLSIVADTGIEPPFTRLLNILKTTLFKQLFQEYTHCSHSTTAIWVSSPTAVL